MKHLYFAINLFLAAITTVAARPALASGQTPEPPLPVVDYKACPFEGCTFQKWIVSEKFSLYSTWRRTRVPVASVVNGEIVAGLTGVHITHKPTIVEILQPLPELNLVPGDTLLRYMTRGEGFADIWAKGVWHRSYDCTFITEKDNSGCLLRDCAALVKRNGAEEWWVKIRTAEGTVGWTKQSDNIDCLDSLAGETVCNDLNSGKMAAAETATSLGEARAQIDANLRTPEGKAYDEKFGAELLKKHPDLIRSCKKSTGANPENFWILLHLAANGKVDEVLLYPTTKIGSCSRDVVLNDTYSPPPRPAYWVGIYLKLQ